MLCLRSVYALTPRWRLSHRLWQQLWYMLIIRYVFVYILHWIFFPSQISPQSLQYKLQAQYTAFYFFIKDPDVICEKWGSINLAGCRWKPAEAVPTSVHCIWYPRRLNTVDLRLSTSFIFQRLSMKDSWIFGWTELFPRCSWGCGVARCGVTSPLQHVHFQSHKHVHACEHPHISMACIRAFSLLLFMSWQSNTIENTAMMHIYSVIIYIQMSSEPEIMDSPSCSHVQVVFSLS